MGIVCTTESPGSLRATSECLRVSGNSPSLRECFWPHARVSERSRGKTGHSRSLRALPECPRGLRRTKALICRLPAHSGGSGAFARGHVWELTSFAGSFSLSAKHEHRRSAEPELVTTFEGKPPSVVGPRFPVSGFPKTSGPGKVVGGALETVPGFPGNASGC